MSTISRQVVINHLLLPKEVIEIIKEYTFHKIKLIPENDERYNKLYTIEPKIYDPTTNHTYVYLTINDQKDYYIVYLDFEIQVQVFRYETNRVIFIDGARYIIE
jgi:hypothetical protein